MARSSKDRILGNVTIANATPTPDSDINQGGRNTVRTPEGTPSTSQTVVMPKVSAMSQPTGATAGSGGAVAPTVAPTGMTTAGTQTATAADNNGATTPPPAPPAPPAAGTPAAEVRSPQGDGRLTTAPQGGQTRGAAPTTPSPADELPRDANGNLTPEGLSMLLQRRGGQVADVGAPAVLPEDNNTEDDAPFVSQYDAPTQLSYEQFMAAVDRDIARNRPLTPEEEEREKKRRKREAVFSALGDGISALSNLYFTTQYAPNAYTPSASLSKKSQERWEKLKAEREKQRDRYLTLLGQKAGTYGKLAADEHARNAAAKKAALERQKEQREAYIALENLRLAIDKAERDGRLKDAQTLKAMYEATEAEINARYAPYRNEAEIGLKQAQTYSATQSGNASGARAAQIKQNRKGTTLTLHDGENETSADFFVPESKWNMANISHLYSILGGPEEIKTSMSYLDEDGNPKDRDTWRKPKREEMEDFIGRNLNINWGNDDTRMRVRKAVDYIQGLSE